MRNLIEYTKDESDPDYSRLTSLLHWKADSDQITVAELDAIYGRLFFGAGQSVNGTDSLLNLIDTEATACLQAPDGINFENKVVLAIATRLQAEKYMAAKINDAAWLASIDGNQTPLILKRYCQEFPTEAAAIQILKRVTLMTPENIHLNSFSTSRSSTRLISICDACIHRWSHFSKRVDQAVHYALTSMSTSSMHVCLAE